MTHTPDSPKPPNDTDEPWQIDRKGGWQFHSERTLPDAFVVEVHADLYATLYQIVVDWNVCVRFTPEESNDHTEADPSRPRFRYVDGETHSTMISISGTERGSDLHTVKQTFEERSSRAANRCDLLVRQVAMAFREEP